MKPKKILLIDDEMEAVNLLSGFLTLRGFDIAVAFDGEEALKKFDMEKPDIILCDIKMPKMDGFQLIKELRNTKRWVPIIMISALTEPVNIFKSYDLEADHYITKPIDLENALRVIKTILSLSSSHREG